MIQLLNNVKKIHMNQFSDIFTYESFERVCDGKIFKGCKLLRCAMYNTKEDDLWETGEIRDSVKITEPLSDWILYFDRKDTPPNIAEILHSIRKDPVTPIHEIEDRFGTVLCDSYLFIANEFKKYFSDHARVIQRCWRNCSSNPSYTVCKKRLMSEFYSLVGEK